MHTMTSFDYARLLDQLFDPSLFVSNVIPTATFKDGVYTTFVEAPGADKTKFDININTKNVLVVRYDGSEGYRCRPFHHVISLGNNKIDSTEATYVDGVLTVTVRTEANTNSVRKITIN